MVCGQIASSSTKPITPCNLNMTRYRGASHSFMFLGSSRYMVVAQTHWPPRIDQNWTLLWVHLSSILPIQTKIPWFRIFAVRITTNAVSGSLPSMKFICFPIFWATELWLVVATVDFPFLNLSNRTRVSWGAPFPYDFPVAMPSGSSPRCVLWATEAAKIWWTWPSGPSSRVMSGRCFWSWPWDVSGPCAPFCI